MHTDMEVAMRVADLGSPTERRGYAETIVRLVMGSEISARTLQRAHDAEEDSPRACTAASLVFMAARLMLDEQESTGSRQLLIAKLTVSRMEKRLIGFVKSNGVRAWSHSCEFIVGPYASAAQFAQVQARYAALGRSASIVDPDPGGFAGA
jgi:hypothetical protein